MTILILGLLLFLGIHATRIFADGARSRFIAQRGANAWKGLYTLISGVGLAAIIWGYGAARAQPVALWQPLPGMAWVAGVLTWIALVLLAAAYVPRNSLKAGLHHPMVLSVKAWALAHLLANHTLADVLLFGGFLLWAALSFRAARARDRAAGTVYAPGTGAATAITVVAGTLAWAALAFWLHGPLIGVPPFG